VLFLILNKKNNPVFFWLIGWCFFLFCYAFFCVFFDFLVFIFACFVGLFVIFFESFQFLKPPFLSGL